MATLAEYQQSQRIAALVFGRFKVGKTFGAATWPRPNFLMFDRDGIATLTNPDFIAKHGWKGDLLFEEFRDKNKDKWGAIKTHNALDDACRYFDKWMTPTYRDKFDTWVVDSGTSLTEACRNKAIYLMSQAGMGVKSNTLEIGHKTGMIAPKVQDYGAERSMLEQFIQMLLDTDKHVLFLCHEKEITSDSGSVEAIVPALTGQSVDAVSVKFSEVWNVARVKQAALWIPVVKTSQTMTLKVGSRLGIPDGTPFDYSSITKALATSREQAKVSSPSAPTTKG